MAALNPDPTDASVSYPMRVVTRLTGLQPDTIRAWERRYHAVSPRRTDGNTRMFTADDVRRLTLLREVTELGHPIGQVADLTTTALEDLIADDARAEARPAATGEQGLALIVEQYLGAVGRFDARRAQEILLRAAAVLPARDFLFDVALPIVREVGQRWAHAALGVAQEHLVSAQVRGLLMTFTRMYPPDPGARRVVVTTPEGQRHEFGALVGALLAAVRGLEVIYLGTDLPDPDLRWAVEMSQAHVLLLSTAVALPPDEAERLAATLDSLPPRVQIWFGMPPETDFTHPRVRRFTSFEALEVALADLGR